jgi:hypothetical protein
MSRYNVSEFVTPFLFFKGLSNDQLSKILAKIPDS